MPRQEFWVQPKLMQPKVEETHYVIYREDGNELPVIVREGKLKTIKESLRPAEQHWFNKNVLIN